MDYVQKLLLSILKFDCKYFQPHNRVRDSTNGSSQTSDSQPSPFGHPIDNELVQWEENHSTWCEAEHLEDNELPDGVSGIHRSIHLQNDEDLLSHRNEYDNYSNDQLDGENEEVRLQYMISIFQ